jgi:hypothetical protein
MTRDPLDTLAMLRDAEVAAAQRSLADARAATAAQHRAADAAEAALSAEQPGSLPVTYGAFLACGLADRQAQRAALARAEAAEEAERDALARARAAEKVVGMLRGRQAARRRRDTLRREQLRLEDALPRG